MTGLDEQIELLKLIGSQLESRVECFIIGGSAMLFYGIKNATKDIDMVFLGENERKKVIDILEKSGFYKKYFKDKDIFLLERRDAKVDLFLKDVMKFKISPAMTERKKEVHEFGNLVAMIPCHEDIILLKCATDREGDRIDAKNIIEKFDINWKTLIEEAAWQNETTKNVISLFLYDFLLELKDMGLDIPKNALKELKKMSEKEMEKLK